LQQTNTTHPEPPAFEWLPHVDSTNSEALRRARQGRIEDALVLATDDQTAGRGRRGRAWTSRVGHSLCLSYIFRMDGLSGRPAPSVVCGWALAEALNARAWPVRLKWPNDLLAQGRKLGGLLCESHAVANTRWLVVGLGLNLRQWRSVDLDAALGGIGAVALEQMGTTDAPHPIDPLELARYLGGSLHTAMTAWGQHSLPTNWWRQARRFDAWRGQAVALQDEGQWRQAGRALGVDAAGRYRLATAAGLVTVDAGDLSLRQIAS
jgi:BirA family biotin operon repressor/biotin-[acetyl-CoA-carboxylase] ligase